MGCTANCIHLHSSRPLTSKRNPSVLLVCWAKRCVNIAGSLSSTRNPIAVLSGLGKPVWGSLLQLLALDQPACLHKAQLQSTEAALLVKHKWFSYLLYKKKMLCKAASNLLTARFYTQRGGFIISVHAGKLILFLVAYWVLVNKLQEERLKKKMLAGIWQNNKIAKLSFFPHAFENCKMFATSEKMSYLSEML